MTRPTPSAVRIAQLHTASRSFQAAPLFKLWAGGDEVPPDQYKAAKTYYEQMNSEAWAEAKLYIQKAVDGGEHAPDSSVEKWLRLAHVTHARSIIYWRLSRAYAEAIRTGTVPPVEVPSTVPALLAVVGEAASEILLTNLAPVNAGRYAHRAEAMAREMFPGTRRKTASYRGMCPRCGEWAPVDPSSGRPFIAEHPGLNRKPCKGVGEIALATRPPWGTGDRSLLR